MIVLPLTLFFIFPILVQSQNQMCNSYKQLQDDDSDYSSDKCFRLELRPYGIFPDVGPPNKINLNPNVTHYAYVAVMLNTNSTRCSSYFVDQIDVIVTGYRGVKSNTTNRQQIGAFTLTEVFARPSPQPKFDCSARNTNESIAFPIRTDSSSKGPVTSTLINCPKPPTNMSIYNYTGNISPQILSMKFPSLTYQPNPELWAGWGFRVGNISRNITTDVIVLDVIAEISYKNRNSSSETRKKLEGLMRTSANVYGNTNMAHGCDLIRSGTGGFPTALRPSKTNYSVNLHENLCRCLQFSATPVPSPVGFQLTGDVSQCLSFSIILPESSTEIYAVAGRADNQCPNTVVTSIQIEEVIFSSLNEKGFPYGKWEPVVDDYSTRDLTEFQSLKSNPFWKKEKCFYSLARTHHGSGIVFYRNVFGVPVSANTFKFPDFLRLRRRPSNAEVFVGRFVPPEVDDRNTYIPKNIQVHAYFLVSGDAIQNSNPIAFRQFISMHSDHALKVDNSTVPYQIGLIEPDPKYASTRHQQLNEEYFDELNYIFKINNGNNITDQSLYTCSDTKPINDHLCSCFIRTRKTSNAQELGDLVKQDPEKWTLNGTTEACFELKAEFRGNDAVVVFRHKCPWKLEVIETAVQALSHNGLPFGTDWKAINLGFGADPDTWKGDTCKKLAGLSDFPLNTVVRETWEPLRSNCSNIINGELRLQQQMTRGEQSYLFIANRPMTGSRKGDPAWLGIVISFCAFFEWSPAKTASVRRREFEFQFLAQAVVEDFNAIPPINTTIIVRSNRYTRQPTFNLDPPDMPLPEEVLPFPGVRTSEIDLNGEYSEQLSFESSTTCVRNPPSFDEFEDELCTCFLDHPRRGRPDTSHKDLLLGFQVQTDISVKYAGSPWKVVAKINLHSNLNQLYGPYELVIEVLTPLSGDVRSGLPVGKWSPNIFVGPDVDQHCTRANVKGASSLVHNCTVGQNSASFAEVSGHSPSEPPNAFHFLNPWLDDFHHICMEWEYIPGGNPNVSTSQIFQLYAQLLFEERPPKSRKRSTTYYSTPIHSRTNFKFTANGRGITLVPKEPHIHDDDFRISLHPSYVQSERATACTPTDLEEISVLELPRLPIFDSNTCTRFHSFPFVQRIDLEGADPASAIYANCFTLDAFPLKDPSKLHVRFRQFDKTVGDPAVCASVMCSEILVQALDQDGNPIGTSEASFNIYDQGAHQTGDDGEICRDEDVLKPSTAFSENREHRCRKFTRSPNNPENLAFISDGGKFTPTIFHATFDELSDGIGGICFTWSFDEQDYRKNLGLTISEVQFIAELFVPNARGTAEGRVFVVRSPKYSFNVRARDLGVVPKCHDDTLLSSRASIQKIPITPDNNATYNILINEDQYRACKQSNPGPSCTDTTHSPNPNPVTELPFVGNGSSEGSASTTFRPGTNVPEKIFRGCLTTKGCFDLGEPTLELGEAGCIERVNCKYLLAYGKTEGEDNEEDEVVMELYARRQRWIAVGLSRDKFMGEDFVIECVRQTQEATQNQINHPYVYGSWNNQKRNIRLPSSRGDSNFTQVSDIFRVKETVQSAISIYCKFYIKQQFMVKDPKPGENRIIPFDLKNTEYCLIAAWGGRRNRTNKEPEGSVLKHAVGDTDVCDNPVHLVRQFLPTSTQVYLIQAHGVCMTIAFVFFLSVGNFIGQFYQDILPQLSYFKKPLWLGLHLMSVFAGLFFVVFGILFYILGMYGVESRMRKKWFHPVVGYFILVMFFVNSLMGSCLKSNNNTKRSGNWSLAHSVIGYVIQFSAFALIAEVHKIPFSSISCVLGYMGLAWANIYAYLNIFMVFHEFWVPAISGDRDDGKSRVSLIHALTEGKSPQLRLSFEGPGKTVRIQALMVFSGIAFLFMITMNGMIIVPPIGPCWVGERPLYFEL